MRLETRAIVIWIQATERKFLIGTEISRGEMITENVHRLRCPGEDHLNLTG
jgi:hypothetical protein